MRVHAVKTLKLFWKKFPDSQTGLKYWYNKIESGSFHSPQDVILQFKKADYVGNERVVFNINQNKYRLVAAFNFSYQLCFIKFIGNHMEYNSINPKSIKLKK